MCKTFMKGKKSVCISNQHPNKSGMYDDIIYEDLLYVRIYLFAIIKSRRNVSALMFLQGKSYTAAKL